MNDIIVSIIIPIYNVKPYLNKCIESVINQTIRQIEIILVDDGSTDGSSGICDSYADKDERITVIHQNNNGLVAARKQGINAAKGKYIGFVDGDDYVASNMFEKLAKYIDETGVDFVHSGYIKDGKCVGVSARRVVTISGYERKRFIKEMAIWKPRLLCGITPSIWSKLFRKDVLKDAYLKIPNEAFFGEDILCLIELMMIANSMAFLDEAYYYYNVRAGSLSNDVEIKSSIRKILTLSDNIETLLRNEGWIDVLWEEEETFAISGVLDVIQKRIGRTNVQRFYFGEIGKIRNNNIVIYGAGSVGVDYYTQISRYNDCTVVAWVDKNYSRFNYDFCGVVSPEILSSIEFDTIVIAQAHESIAGEIRESLIQFGIENEKIVWDVPKLLT